MCDGAVASDVAIGAQIGYRDLPGLGSRFIDIEPEALTQNVVYQIGALDALLRIAGSRVRYVKPHGALYNPIVHHEERAAAVVQALLDYDATPPVLGLPGSAWLRRAADAGLRVVHEAFADRACTTQGALVSRRLPEAVLHNPEDIARRCGAMATGAAVADAGGGDFGLTPGSTCVHGDTTGAVSIARGVRHAPTDAEVVLAPFAPFAP